MFIRAQQILLKRAQREAALDDGDYREALEAATGLPGCRSSKDPRLTDSHLDTLLAYFEAVYWRSVDLGRLQPPCRRDAVFRQRRFWALKNTRTENSRDRFASRQVEGEIRSLEEQLSKMGFGAGYYAAIRTATIGGRQDVRSLNIYRAALERTIAAKARKTTATESEAPNETADRPDWQPF